MKAYANPPRALKLVFEAVLVLLDEPIDWATAKKVISKDDFLHRLLTYDRDHISEATIQKLLEYVQNPDLNPEKLKRVGSAASILAEWVHAVYQYHLAA